MLTYRLLRLLAAGVNALPPPGRRALGDGIRNTAWLLLPRRRRDMAVTNISRSLDVGPAAAREIAKASTVRFGRMLMEVLGIDRLTRESVNSLVSFRGREYLDDAVAAGGCILATAHSGNWELLSAALSLNGYPLAAIAQKQHNAAMDRFINEQRQAPGAEIVYRSDVRDMVRLLDRGKIIGLLMDQDSHRQGVFVPFFGRLASTPVGPAAIARLRGAPIVPVFIHELAAGRHEIVVHPALTVAKTRNREEDIYQATLQLTQIVEAHIRQHPTEWFWLHNRWKTPPPGDDCR